MVTWENIQCWNVRVMLLMYIFILSNCAIFKTKFHHLRMRGHIVLNAASLPRISAKFENWKGCQSVSLACYGLRKQVPVTPNQQWSPPHLRLRYQGLSSRDLRSRPAHTIHLDLLLPRSMKSDSTKTFSFSNLHSTILHLSNCYRMCVYYVLWKTL